jgi:hypothetical protein
VCKYLCLHLVRFRLSGNRISNKDRGRQRHENLPGPSTSNNRFMHCILPARVSLPFQPSSLHMHKNGQHKW